MPNPLIVPSGYTIKFINALSFIDPVFGLLQTFTYRLTVPVAIIPEFQISDYAIELCDNHIVVRIPPFQPTTPNNTPVIVDTRCPLKPCMSSLDPTAKAQIKFDNLNNQNAGGLYTFTLMGSFPIADVTLALKVGNTCPLGACQGGLIPGPACKEVPPPPPPPPPPPGRGVQLNKIHTLIEE